MGNIDLKDMSFRREIGQSCACFNLRRAARLVTQRFDLKLRQSGLKANQFSILMVSYDQEGILLTKMARILGMERTTLTRNLSLLERSGFITIGSGEDRRERRIMITQKGACLLEKALPLWKEAQRELLESLGHETWNGMLVGLKEIARKR